MTVKELIEKLQEMPQDAPVVTKDYEYMQYDSASNPKIITIGISRYSNHNGDISIIWEDYDKNYPQEEVFVAVVV